MASDKKKKTPALLWKGVLASAKPGMRRMVLVIFAVACVALTFTQLGFVGIGAPGGYVAYAVVLLQPIALTALLLGCCSSALVGLLAGLVLNLHSQVMPLDYYELTFVTPTTSVAMLTIAGILLGLFFALALRNDPPRAKRVTRIVIICFVVSILYSLGFMVSSLITLVERIAASGNLDGASNQEIQKVVESMTATFLLRIGHLGIQALFDAALMAVLCLLGDEAARRVLRQRGNVGVREVFNGWLFVVVLLAFMVTSVTSFVSITMGEFHTAHESMATELDYLNGQLKSSSKKTDALDRLFESLGVNATLQNMDERELDELLNHVTDDLMEAFSSRDVLEGYTEVDDGVVVISDKDGLIYLSDTEKFAPGERVEEALGADIAKAIDAYLETKTMQRVVFDNIDASGSMNTALSSERIPSQLAYLCACKAPENQVATIIRPASMVYEERLNVMAWTTLTVFIVLLSVFVMVSRLLNDVIISRIDETNTVLDRITQGDLDERVEVRDTREFQSLSEGINGTVGALKGWIAEAESRMDAELAAAGAIQEAALPRIFPPFPDILHFDVYASMTPAKEVGGDFYDFFLMSDDANADEGKLGFVVADVSGKGIPAALFMMAAKALIRDYMRSGMELGEAFENVNRQLCDGNDSDMFVTVFAGVLDYATGHVDYVNAGHNPPLLWRDGAWDWLRVKSGLPLGIFDGMPYRAHSVDCEVGDQFLIYTDGVTEAMDVGGEQYGEERLLELVQDRYAEHPRMLVDAVRRDVARYTTGAEQSDDITIFALEVGVPPEITATLTVPAKIEELATVNEFIHSELDRRLCPMRAQIQLDVAVEELFVNVCSYAYPDATPEHPGIARISYTYSADPPSIKIDLIDNGIPYNPLEKPDAVTPPDIEDVPIGGLGILMAKRSVDEMSYERLEGSNVVSIVKKW